MHMNVEECLILYCKLSKPPTCICFGNACDHPQGGASLRMYYKNLSNQ
jgi:hypothetical protein